MSESTHFSIVQLPFIVVVYVTLNLLEELSFAINNQFKNLFTLYETIFLEGFEKHLNLFLSSQKEKVENLKLQISCSLSNEKRLTFTSSSST